MSHKTKWSNEEKLAAVAEWDAGGSAEDIAKRMGVTTSGLGYWRRTLKKGAPKKGAKAVVVSRTATFVEPHAARDAIIFLRKAKSELMRGIRDGRIDDLDNTHLLSLLALRSLQGGG